MNIHCLKLVSLAKWMTEIEIWQIKLFVRLNIQYVQLNRERDTYAHLHATRSFSQSICSAEYFVFLYFSLFFISSRRQGAAHIFSLSPVCFLYIAQIRLTMAIPSIEKEWNSDRFEAERVRNGFLLYFDEILS